MSVLLNYDVLVLNQNYEPLNVCHVRRAIVLLFNGKAETVENGRGHIYTTTRLLDLPSVIRLFYMVKKPIMRRKLTRREVFERDRYKCQYCGRQTRDLTLDHVMPRFRGGKHSWDNIVSACMTCNHRKAARTPQEAGMRLLHVPTAPPLNPYHIFYHHLHSRQEWQKFIPAAERWLRGEFF